MRILFLTPSPPRPDGGGAAIRNWHLIDAARGAGHRIDVGMFGEPHWGVGEVMFWTDTPPARSPRRRMNDLLRRDPDLAIRLRSSDLEYLTHMRVQNPFDPHDRSKSLVSYDLIQVEGLEMWPNVPTSERIVVRADREPPSSAARQRRMPSATPRREGRLTIRPGVPLPPIIYDAHNAEATLQERTMRQSLQSLNFPGAAYSLVQWQKLRVYERGAIREAAATLAVSPEDAAALEQLSGRPVDVVPIGVDTARYRRDAPSLAPPVPFDVVFSGTLDYRPNTDAALWLLRDIWPRIRAAKPDATLAVVGRSPTPALMGYDGKHGVTITGAVPDDRPYMAGAAVYALPIRFGAGVRVKLLNAMSMGGAVVATAMAAEGVDARHGEHLVTAPSHAGAFAAAVVSLLDDPSRRARLGDAARSLMVSRYDWALVTPALLRVYERLERRDG